MQISDVCEASRKTFRYVVFWHTRRPPTQQPPSLSAKPLTHLQRSIPSPRTRLPGPRSVAALTACIDRLPEQPDPREPAAAATAPRARIRPEDEAHPTRGSTQGRTGRLLWANQIDRNKSPHPQRTQKWAPCGSGGSTHLPQPWDEWHPQSHWVPNFSSAVGVHTEMHHQAPVAPAQSGPPMEPKALGESACF